MVRTSSPGASRQRVNGDRHRPGEWRVRQKASANADPYSFFQQQERTTKRALPVTVMYFTGKTAAPGGEVLPENRVSV